MGYGRFLSNCDAPRQTTNYSILSLNLNGGTPTSGLCPREAAPVQVLLAPGTTLKLLLGYYWIWRQNAGGGGAIYRASSRAGTVTWNAKNDAEMH